QEVVLNDLALVAERDHELVHAAGLEGLHDVPEDRPASDLDHRLGLDRRLFREPGAEAPGEDHRLHALTSAPAAPRAATRPSPSGAGPKRRACRARSSSTRRPCGSSTSW